MSWHPHVTVAAVIERAGQFLLVEEQTRHGLQWNQPAGHWEPGETLLEAAIRETREEAAVAFQPTAIVGVYVWSRPDTTSDEDAATFLRVTFTGALVGDFPDQPLDEGIVRAHWATRDEIASQPDRLRSPMVLQAVDHHLAGVRHSLDLIHHLEA
ncbi:MAG: NUDIX hydrolase [Pseudomonadota bacterium]|nr:NUDIX hydrolase [Pseudomonadota bacterium]